MNKFALEITNLKKIYDSGTVALKGINLSVAEGDFLLCLGLMVRASLLLLALLAH